MSYRLEISANNRATCANKECKDKGDKCIKGTLRHGTMVTIHEHQSWKWRHWGCVTPVQIANMKEKTEDNLEYLDGYEELPEDLQEQVRRAMEQGHVDDEDWNGDVEMNRPGMKGFRSPATKKAAKDREAENGERSASPSKPATKKRERIKKAEEEDASDAQEPPAKKPRAAAKKRKQIKEDGSDLEAAKKRGRILKAEEEDASDAQEPPAKKPRAAAKKRKQIKEEGSDSEAANAGAAPTKTARAPANGKKTKAEDSGAEARTAKKARAPSKRKKAMEETDDANDGSSVEAPPPRKARGKKKIAESSNDIPAPDGVGDGTLESAPKAKKGRKKAVVNAAGDVLSRPNNTTTEKPRRGRKP